jgi:hypothetical protein
MTNKRNFVEYIAATVFLDYDSVKEQLIISTIISVLLTIFGIVGNHVVINIFSNDFIAQIMSSAVIWVSIMAVASIWIAQIMLCVTAYIKEKKNNKKERV